MSEKDRPEEGTPRTTPPPRFVPPPSDLESQAAAAIGRMLEQDTEAAGDGRRKKNRFLVGWSLVVIGLVLLVAVFQGPTMFGAAPADTTVPSQLVNLIPYMMCLVGVLLFVMNTARKKDEHWRFDLYYGDHVFRVAQAFGYLLIVWWAWASVGDAGGVPGTALTPNVMGFLVGFFILRVERAMEGLGDKFEELLKAILPRAVAYQSAEDRRRLQLRSAYRIEDILTEWTVIRPQLDDLGARDLIDQAIDAAVVESQGEDPERARKAVAEVSRLFEEVKRRGGEVLVPVEELLPRPGD